MKSNVVERKYLIPFILVTSLFAFWGFANAVTDPMVQAFKKVLELSNSQAAWVQMAFYGGYFCMALPAAIIMRKYSYKTGIIIGLALYAAGALLFYPAAITEKFWFFCLGLYILTFGLAFLETAANPYTLAMGSPETATQRLNLAQAFNPVGLILGLFVAQQYVLQKLQSDTIIDFSALETTKRALIRTQDLIVIRDPYVVLGLTILVILVLFVVYRMPSIKDDNPESLSETLSKLVKLSKYRFGVFTQVLYVGAQIMCWTYIYQYGEAKGISNVDSGDYQMIAFLLFIVGRVTGTALLSKLSPGRLLGLFSIGAMIMLVFVILSNGLAGMYALVVVSFFMSLMFPTIYGIALGGLSKNEAQIGSAGLVMAIVGGALMPKLQGIVIDIGGNDVADMNLLGISEMNWSFLLPLVCFLGIGYYGFWANKSLIQEKNQTD